MFVFNHRKHAETTLKTEGAGKDSEKYANNNMTAKEDDLKSSETLRESPVQWPERCKYHIL